MRKAIPCKQCGIVQLPVQGDYIIGSIPHALTIRGGVLVAKCLCGRTSKLTRQGWNSLPDLDSVSNGVVESVNMSKTDDKEIDAKVDKP